MPTWHFLRHLRCTMPSPCAKPRLRLHRACLLQANAPRLYQRARRKISNVRSFRRQAGGNITGKRRYATAIKTAWLCSMYIPLLARKRSRTRVHPSMGPSALQKRTIPRTAAALQQKDHGLGFLLSLVLVFFRTWLCGTWYEVQLRTICQTCMQVVHQTPAALQKIDDGIRQ